MGRHHPYKGILHVPHTHIHTVVCVCCALLPRRCQVACYCGYYLYHALPLLCYFNPCLCCSQFPNTTAPSYPSQCVYFSFTSVYIYLNKHIQSVGNGNAGWLECNNSSLSPFPLIFKGLCVCDGGELGDLVIVFLVFFVVSVKGSMDALCLYTLQNTPTSCIFIYFLFLLHFYIINTNQKKVPRPLSKG